MDGKILVLTTTNGARALAALSQAKESATAGFVNLGACARTVANEERVAIVCAGSEGRFSLEDFLCAGMLVEAIEEAGGPARLDDGARTARQVARARSDDLLEALRRTDHGRNLAELGFEHDLALATAVDRFDFLPILRDGRLVAEVAPEAARPR